jgi:hypothetical protein
MYYHLRFLFADGTFVEATRLSWLFSGQWRDNIFSTRYAHLGTRPSTVTVNSARQQAFGSTLSASRLISSFRSYRILLGLLYIGYILEYLR